MTGEKIAPSCTSAVTGTGANVEVPPAFCEIKLGWDGEAESTYTAITQKIRSVRSIMNGVFMLRTIENFLLQHYQEKGEMDLIRDNINTLRDSIQRNQFSETTAIDVLTALHVVYQKRLMDYSVSDDKHFAFILGCLRNVPAGSQRKHWFKTMFTTYEKLSNIDVNDPNWLLLQANLIYLSPLGTSCYP